MPVHNTTGTPNGPGQIGVSAMESIRLEARQRVGGQPLQAVDWAVQRADDGREWWPGKSYGGRKPEPDEIGLSCAEAVYLTRAHVLNGAA